MTITTILQQIHLLYENDISYPSSGEDDHTLRMGLVNQAINMWATQEGIIWNELFKTGQFTTDGTAQYDDITDLNSPAGFLRIYTNGTSVTPDLYQYVKPEEAESIQKSQDTSKKIYWITGAQGVKKINVYPTPATGLTARLDYYKDALTYSTGAESTEIEMSDPYFAIEWALAQLYLIDQDTVNASVHQQIAQQKLNAMRIKNEAYPPYGHNMLQNVYEDGFGI